MASIQQPVEPWPVPQFIELCGVVSHGNGTTSQPKMRIEDVHPETLSDLCDEFRRRVFQKAGKPDPQNNCKDD